MPIVMGVALGLNYPDSGHSLRQFLCGSRADLASSWHPAVEPVCYLGLALKFGSCARHRRWSGFFILCACGCMLLHIGNVSSNCKRSSVAQVIGKLLVDCDLQSIDLLSVDDSYQ